MNRKICEYEGIPVWLDDYNAMKEAFGEDTKNIVVPAMIKDKVEQKEEFYIDIFFRNRFYQGKSFNQSDTKKDLIKSWKFFADTYSDDPKQWLEELDFRRTKFEAYSFVGASMAVHRLSLKEFGACVVPVQYGCRLCVEHTPRKEWEHSDDDQVSAVMAEAYQNMEVQRVKKFKDNSSSKIAGSMEDFQGPAKKTKISHAGDNKIKMAKVMSSVKIPIADKFDKLENKIDTLSGETKECLVAVKNMLQVFEGKNGGVVLPKLPKISTLTRNCESGANMNDFTNKPSAFEEELKKVKEELKKVNEELRQSKEELNRTNTRLARQQEYIIQNRADIQTLDGNQEASTDEVKNLQQHYRELHQVAISHERFIAGSKNRR